MKPVYSRALGVASFVALALASFARTGGQPNVIFIISDDLGYADLGTYGQKQIHTPALDKMAAEGLRFTQFYAGSAVCAPSRASLLTGLHMGHSHIRGNGNPAQPSEPVTLGRLMKDAGYYTSNVGKWGMGKPGTTGAPLAQGFDEFRGFLGHTEAHEQYPKALTKDNDPWPLPEGTYANDVFTTEALDFVKRNKERPFFLYLSYTIPHMHMIAPSKGEYANRDWPEPEVYKAAMISRMDSQIGQLFEELKAQGLDENTIVFFTSDNGPHHEQGVNEEFFDSNGPLRGLKRDLYEGGIRVPMIVRWPGHVASGTSDQQWAMWDVLPTVLDLAGTQAPEGRDGISLKPTLLTGTPVKHDPLYWEFYEGGFTQAIRKDDWKLVKTSTSSLELYDLKTDLSEQNNIAAKHPEVIMELMPLLSSMRTESELWKVSEVNEKAEQKRLKKQKQGQNRKQKNQKK